MLKRLHVKNFTVFADAEFEFGPGLNVLVGTNGTGKSHVLKLGYGILKGLRGQLLRSAVSRGDVEVQNRLMQVQGKKTYNPFFADVLLGIFRPSPLKLQELVRRGKEEEASVVFDLYNEDVATGHYRFDMLHASEQPLVHSSPALVTPAETVDRIEAQVAPPILIPAKEVLTLGWMAAASDTLVLPLDDSYLDLLSQLGRLPLRNPELGAQLAAEKITQIVGGELEQRGGNFYLISLNQGPMDVGMIAEGMRKFGTLQRLLSNGGLTSKTTLFWDEPESNLNPALLRKLAAILAELARKGFQIILATHSMSLLKQFHILSRQPAETPLPIYYFGLNAEPGQPTTVIRRDNFEYLPDVVALEVELEQADDLEEIFAREDRQANADHTGGR